MGPSNSVATIGAFKNGVIARVGYCGSVKARVIRRQHSQHMALLDLAVKQKDPNAGPEMAAVRDESMMRNLIDWWDSDAREASERAEEE